MPGPSTRDRALDRYDRELARSLERGLWRLARADAFRPAEPARSLLLIGQTQRSGGTLMSRLLDGHPQLHVYPLELYWGSPDEYHWATIDVTPRDRAEAEQVFRTLACGGVHHLARFSDEGYAKGWKKDVGRPLPFLFDLALQQEIFCAAAPATRSGPATGALSSQRQVLDAYLASFFSAWLDYRDRYCSPKSTFVAFGKRHNEPTALESFFADYPDGRLVSIIRDPWSWYGSSARHDDDLYGDLNVAAARWVESTQATLSALDRYGERVHVVLFRDLITATAVTMRRLCRWAGIEWHPSVVTPTFNGMAVPSNSSFTPREYVDDTVLSRPVDPAITSELTSRCGSLYDDACATAVMLARRSGSR